MYLPFKKVTKEDTMVRNHINEANVATVLLISVIYKTIRKLTLVKNLVSEVSVKRICL